MKNYYHILGLSRDANKKQIESAYQTAISRKYIFDGSSDYDNIRDFLDIKEAYRTLIDPIKRFKYDLKTDTQGEKVVYEFEDQTQINDFIKEISNDIVFLFNRILEKRETIKNLGNDIEKLKLEKEKEQALNSKKFEIESSEHNQTKNILSEKIAIIESINKSLIELKNIEKEKIVVEKQNNRLLSIAKNYRNRMFKIITIMIFSFLFIILLLYINFL